MTDEIFWKALNASTTIHELQSFDHGPAHWQRVALNGKHLCEHTPGADWEVVSLFALFHDSMRDNELIDPEHGSRGAKLAFDLGVVPDLLDPEQWGLFFNACFNHDKGQITDDPTIGVCWDADRLDLPRIGIMPSVRYMSTEEAIRMIGALEF